MKKKSIMKILVAVDGSEHSLGVVKYTVEQAGWYSETPTVELVYVHLRLPYL